MGSTAQKILETSWPRKVAKSCRITVYYHNLFGSDDRDYSPSTFTVYVDPTKKQPVTWRIAYGHWGCGQNEQTNKPHTACDSWLIYSDARGTHKKRIINNSGSGHYAENPRFSGSCAPYMAAAPTGTCGAGPPLQVMAKNKEDPSMGKPQVDRSYRIKSLYWRNRGKSMYWHVDRHGRVRLKPLKYATQFTIRNGKYEGLK